MVDDQLTVLVEVIDGALGSMSPESLGRRLLTTVQRLIAQWDNPLRDVSVLLDGEATATAADRILTPTGTGVHTKFTEIAYSRLASRALSWSDGELTYRELDEAADRLAAGLVARGVRDESPVAINLSRGPQYVIAMLGVLKAGGVIVPLDPAMPADRIADILNQCGATVIVDDALLTTVAARAVRRPSAPSPPVPDRPPTWCSPRAPRAGPRVSSARIRRCWRTPRTTRCRSCDRRRPG